jgi:hypothetical protein
MYNHLPNFDPGRSHNPRPRVRESEETTLRHMHHERALDERARAKQPHVPASSRSFTRPTANAVLALFGMRR